MGRLIFSVIGFSTVCFAQVAVEIDPTFYSECAAGNICTSKYEIGENGGYGLSHFPENISGGPSGVSATKPQSASDKILSLGDGGWIVLKLQKRIPRRDGPELRVFENGFYFFQRDQQEIDPYRVYTELAFVEVSQNGVDFVRFPTRFDRNDPYFFLNPYNLSGFAGVFPVLAKNLLDAVFPQVFLQDGLRSLTKGPGGDDFELEDLPVSLSWFQYVKIIDANGEPSDRGDFPPISPRTSGFDLDAVVGLID